MKKSFIVFSLIGIVAIGMSFTSCKNEATSEALNCSYEESWQQLEQQVEQLNVEYEHLATEKIARGCKVMIFDVDEIELRSKYKGARSGKLMYKMLRRVFSKNFRKSAQGLSDEQVKEMVVNEMENMTGVMDEQFKAQLMKMQIYELSYGLRRRGLAPLCRRVYRDHQYNANRQRRTNHPYHTNQYGVLYLCVLEHRGSAFSGIIC